MMVSRIGVGLLLAWTLIPAAFGAPDVSVQAYTSPAWVSRDGIMQPLTPTTSIKAADQIVTAEGGRAILHLGDGSTVKLGENAKFVIEATSQSKAGGRNLFKAGLRLLEGAFRFTTAALAKSRSDRDVTISLATVTAGIRGTDIWGKAAPNRDFIVLLEGKAEMKRRDEPSVMLDKPLSMIDAPSNVASPPITSVPMDLVQKLALETEIESGSGGSRANGRWKVTVTVASEQTEALMVFDKLRAAGYPAAISPFDREGQKFYGVRIANLASEDDAVALALRLKLRLGYENASISR